MCLEETIKIENLLYLYFENPGAPRHPKRKP